MQLKRLQRLRENQSVPLVSLLFPLQQLLSAIDRGWGRSPKNICFQLKQTENLFPCLIPPPLLFLPFELLAFYRA